MNSNFFSNCITTRDETWIHHYESQRKHQDMLGKLLSVWDSQGPILEHYQGKPQ